MYEEYSAGTEEPRRVPTPSPQWGGMPQEAASRIEAAGANGRAMKALSDVPIGVTEQDARSRSQRYGQLR